MLTIQLPPVYDYQHRAIFTDARYAVIEGATKAGKTYPCIVWLLAEAGARAGPGRNFWWVAPTHEQAEIAYLRTVRLLRSAGGTDWFEAIDSRKRIILADVGTLHFRTSEDPDHLYGEDVYGAVMDEYTRQREEAWTALRSTLSATRGRCRFVGNVLGRRGWGWAWARKAEAGAEGMSYAKITCEDAIKAGIMDRREVEQAERDLAHIPGAFRELYYAEPGADGGNPFDESMIRAAVAPLSPLPPVVFGVDLGRAVDWTVVVGLDQGGSVCVFDRWMRVPWEETVDRIASIVGTTRTLVDRTGLGDPVVDRLSRRCPGVTGYVFTTQSKQDLMQGLALAIHSGAVTFPEGPIAAELRTFEYVSSAGRVRYSAPNGLHDDCVCALALAVHAMTRPRSPVVLIIPDGAEPRAKEDIISYASRRRSEDPEWGFR